jgi:hypothetical protein
MRQNRFFTRWMARKTNSKLLPRRKSQTNYGTPSAQFRSQAAASSSSCAVSSSSTRSAVAWSPSRSSTTTWSANSSFPRASSAASCLRHGITSPRFSQSPLLTQDQVRIHYRQRLRRIPRQTPRPYPSHGRNPPPQLHLPGAPSRAVQPGANYLPLSRPLGAQLSIPIAHRAA